jgi:F-type H+-transporting ATPase subunit delta
MASVVNTYAGAFADVVLQGRHDPQTILSETKSLAELVAASRELREIWAAPSIAPVQKRAVLDAIAKRQGVSQVVRNFIAVLIDHGRINFFGSIVEEFERQLNERLGFVDAEVTSYHDLDGREQQVLEAELDRVTGKKVKARYFRDSSLLGGAVVRVGSTIYDGSVKGQLERIRKTLTSTAALS